ncbi:Glycosyl hydrolases family 6 [Curtobacterium sp. 9128]|uniref:glycoside hydrolase family 6 protein n=1 Tax=Curtobacterium sp. 9128 TaxID=1793722 RepID=UPI0007D73226|nr:glycoside hydrolase family 6 protein [Curtobacterium sp. 9128]SBN63974.1 Glycosyl hydrolases family 6 [Curtobacterium sp. 9128]
MRTSTALTVCIALAGVLGGVIAPVAPIGADRATAATTATDLRSRTAAQLYGNGQYNSPTSEAAKNAAALASSDPAGAAAASTIAKYPVATWLGEWSTGTGLTKTLQSATAGAAANGTTAVFVTYAIPERDCGGYSAGGFDEAGYDAWVDQIVAGLAGKRAAVIVEPDSLAMLSDSRCTPALDQQRYRILSREVAALTAAGIPAYLDAGNSNWVQPATIAARLDAAGVRQARGFFTNVANYYPTAQEQSYAQKVSALTGGSHYVIDTSRNGRGWRGTWCNGPGAGLGTSPRVATDGTALDALLWVKTPGASDGTCNGGPAAGKWYSAYAQQLVANASLGAPAAVTSPQGTVDAAAGGAGTVRVRGWTFDADDPESPVTVRVSVDGTVVGTALADTTRPDVDRAAGVGADHGFDMTVAAGSGTRNVCVTAVNVGAGADRQLGCVAVTVYGHDPVVQLERVGVARAGIVVTGWAVDPDEAASPVRIAVTVDGRGVAAATANLQRADLGAVPDGAGTGHGWDLTVPGGSGKHSVCVVARNRGVGSDTTSACRTVTVAASAPFGTFGSASSPSTRRVDVSGWVFDRDAVNTAVSVVVTVDGNTTGRLTANRARADVDTTYRAGPAHGYGGRVVSPSGTHRICVRAVGLGSGGDADLGCRTVAVR